MSIFITLSFCGIAYAMRSTVSSNSVRLLDNESSSVRLLDNEVLPQPLNTNRYGSQQ